MATSNARPIIIKRKKVAGGGGHHGGAWKVAYADFVTAMMAFFLLMWLLNATTERQRKGIADYFAPTIPISSVTGGGSGLLKGDSIFADDTLAKDGTGSTKPSSTPENKSKGAAQTSQQANPNADNEAKLEDIESLLKGMSGESDAADDLLSHVRTRVTDEGLIIEIFAKDGQPLFRAGSDEPSARMEALLDMVAGVISIVTNDVALEGHTDSIPFSDGSYDNWRLSSDRADVSRRRLLSQGVESERFNRVTGKADTDPAIADDPDDPRNRRITVTLLRSDI